MLGNELPERPCVCYLSLMLFGVMAASLVGSGKLPCNISQALAYRDVAAVKLLTGSCKGTIVHCNYSGQGQLPLHKWELPAGTRVTSYKRHELALYKW